MKDRDGRVRFEHLGELPPTAASLGGTDWNRTGSWKYLAPSFLDRTAPCSDRCMTGIDVVTMMRLVEEGDWEGAVRAVLPANPFPSVTGRVCPHPCMQPCNRKARGGGIEVRAVERAVGDWKLARGIRPALPPADLPPIRVVGSGPAGLSAAVALRTLGHPVVVHETAPEPGGLLRYRIPGFRLPLEVVRAEVEWVRGLGVEIRAGAAVRREDLADGTPTILAFGLGRSRGLGIPGEELPGVLDGVALLAAARSGEAPRPGPRVAVIGGGDTALDVARTLLRLGSAPVVHYRRSLREMPAFREAIEEAREEGVEFRFLSAPLGIEAGVGGVLRLTLAAVELGEPDSSGRPRPLPRPGSETVLEVDAVVKALGETLDRELLPEGVASHGSAVVTDASFRTGRPGVFACGDAAPGAGGTGVGEAIRGGRLAAVSLHGEIAGRPLPADHPLRAVPRGDPEVVKFKGLNMAWFDREAPVAPERVPPSLRSGSFAPVEATLPAQGARREAARCFKCGTCTECGVCFTFCPDFAIVPGPGGGYAVDLEYCKGCGVCVEECPRMAMKLEVTTGRTP